MQDIVMILFTEFTNRKEEKQNKTSETKLLLQDIIWALQHFMYFDVSFEVHSHSFSFKEKDTQLNHKYKCYWPYNWTMLMESLRWLFPSCLM